MDLLTGIVLMVAFFVAAIVLIYLAVRSKRELERKRVDCTEAASGTVEKVRRISVSGESCNYYPTFAFFDGNHIVQEESKIGYARDIWKKGDKVQIKFNANDPSDFFIVHESITTWVWLISIGIGFAVISVFGAVICYFAAKY